MAGMKDIAENYVTPDTLDGALTGWMEEVAPYQWRGVEPLRKEQAALLVVDMNRPFADDGRPLATPNAQAIIPRIEALAGAFRAAARPVLWIIQAHHSLESDRGAHLHKWWPSTILEGTGDVEMANGLTMPGDEKKIYKRRYGGFYQTDLELSLRCLGVSQVVVCGLFTNVCVHATASEAFMRDLDVYLPADCCGALNRMFHVSALCELAAWCGHVVRSAQIVEWMNGGA